MNAPVSKLNDPDSDHLTDELNKLPQKLAALKGFDPDKIPGLIASWNFDQVKEGVYPAAQTNIPGIPVAKTTLVPGITGNAVSVSTNGLVVPLNLKPLIDQEISCSFWVKATMVPYFGYVINVSGGFAESGFALGLAFAGLNFSAGSHSEPLSSSCLRVDALCHYCRRQIGHPLLQRQPSGDHALVGQNLLP